MREIKFRGLRTDNNEWVEGNLINWHEKLEPRIIWFKTEGESISESEQIETNFEVKRDSIGQFTGLHDKKGIEIYEGDIVNSEKWVSVGNYQPCTGIVCFYSPKFTIDLINEWEGSNTELNGLCEVIGNIHTNPELL